MPIHVRPTADLASRALLPGDPGRALLLAQQLLEEPRMFNHHRGLWGYTGAAKTDGELLTIQATGMGGPSTAIVVRELIDLGLEVAVRVGTTGALVPDLPLGSLVVARTALAVDGASRALGANSRADGDPSLTAALAHAAACEPATVVSADLFYDPVDRTPEWRAAGAVSVEMEAATLFTLAAAQGIRAGCVLVVSDLVADGARLGDEELETAVERMGAVAVEAVR